MFDTKSSQIPRTFLWLFSQTFGLDYSPLNSATLSCSSEVTLMLGSTIELTHPRKEDEKYWEEEKGRKHLILVGDSVRVFFK